MTTLQTHLAQADKPTKGPEMTPDNPDPLEVWRAACGKYEDACEAGDTLRDGVILGDQAAAAIIAQHYAPVIAENERLRTTGARLLEWWPEGSGNSLAGHNKGSGFADDLEAFRQALGAKP